MELSYSHVKESNLNATKYDWQLSSWVLSKFPSADGPKNARASRMRTEERQSRIREINARAAAIPFLSVKTLPRSSW